MSASLPPEMQNKLHRLASEWGHGRITLKQILGLTPKELYAMASQAYLMFLEGRTEQARVLFEGLVAIDPRNAYYYQALGSIYWRLGEGEKALTQFSYAIRVAPSQGINYINRAEIHVAQKRFEQASQDLETAIGKLKPHQTTLLQKARAMLRMIQQPVSAY